MLMEDVKTFSPIPVMIECNFNPDCNRAVDWDPDFVNNIFLRVFGASDHIGADEKQKAYEAFSRL